MTRTCIALTGTDRHSFLQNLGTNQVAPGMPPTYAALLSPQGKYIADFFVFEHDDTLIIDVAASHAPTLAQKLMIYRLRADVQIEEAPVFVHLGLGDAPDDGFADPRHSALGWRAYRDTPQEDVPDLVSVRIAHGIPETGIALHADSYILEMGFERLSGVDFKKGVMSAKRGLRA